MGKDPREVRTSVASGNGDPEAIREEIAETREALGDTVAALSRKTDVKARTKDKVEDARATVSERVEDGRATVADKADELAATAYDGLPPSARERLAALQRRACQDPQRAATIAGGTLLGIILCARRLRR